MQKIPDFRLEENETISVNLSDYFIGGEGYEFEASGINFSINGEILSFSAGEIRGSVKAKVIAFRENESLESNEFFIFASKGNLTIITLRDKIEVGKPVKWSKQVLNAYENLSVEIPDDVLDVKVKKIEYGIERNAKAILRGNISSSYFNASYSRGLTGAVVSDINEEPRIISAFKKMFSSITGRASAELNVNEEGENPASEALEIENLENATKLEVILNDNASEYLIEYYTIAPEYKEEIMNDSKIIVISGPDGLSYSDIIANASLEFLNVSNERLVVVYWRNYWLNKTNETVEKKSVSDVEDKSIINDSFAFDNFRSEAENGSLWNLYDAEGIGYVREEVPAEMNDTDGDGKLDIVKWVVSHLSNQTYEITLRTNITAPECSNASSCFFIKNSSGENKAIFDSFGNVDIKGLVFERNLSIPDGRDFIIQNASGGVAAWADDITGNFYFAGNISSRTNDECLPPAGSFIIRNLSGSCASYIDSSGNLAARGIVNEKAVI